MLLPLRNCEIAGVFLPPARDSLRFLFIVVAGEREALESRLYVEKELLTIYTIGEGRDSDLTTNGKKKEKKESSCYYVSLPSC